MSTFHLRFVGIDSLPKTLSQADVDEAFSLSGKDAEEIRTNFRGPGRLGAAVQLVVLRATGRSPDVLVGVPKALLQSLTRAVGAREIDIGSLRSIYQRRQTRFAHQKWAREYAGFAVIDDATWTDFNNALAQLSNSAVSVDDLTREAALWLYRKQCVLPGDRALRDAARMAFAAQDRAAMQVVRDGVPERELSVALSRLFSKRKGPTGATVLEWLRTPPGKHGKATLRETTQKIAFLKTLRVHEWKLAAIPLNRMQAYSRAVVNRPPVATARLSEDQRTLELCCFLYTTLLDLTDTTVDIAARRVCDLVRGATSSVERKQAASSIGLRAERSQIKVVLYSHDLTDRQKVAALQEMLPSEEEPTGSHAALVRQSLVEESAAQVSALLNALAVVEVHGDESNRAVRQVRYLRDLAERGASELPPEFDLSMAQAP